MELTTYPTLAPSVCFICEGVPPETAFVDTSRTFEPGGFTHLNGRKYVCASCGGDIASALNIQQDAQAQAEAYVAEMQERVNQLEADIASYEAIKGAIAQLHERPVVQIEDKVAQTTAKIAERKASEKAAAKAAQKQLKVDTDAAAEGAARQIEQDKLDGEHVARMQVQAVEQAETLALVQAQGQAAVIQANADQQAKFGQVPEVEADPGPPLSTPKEQ